jgi:hypothetical protein
MQNNIRIGDILSRRKIRDIRTEKSLCGYPYPLTLAGNVCISYR